MKTVNKKIIDGSQAAVLLIIINIIAVAISLVIANVIEASLIFKGIIFGSAGIISNFLLAKYLLNKKFEITSKATSIKKYFFTSFIIVVILFALYGSVDFGRAKSSAHIVMLPIYNYSTELKAVLNEKSRYPLSFSPVTIFNRRDATLEDIEKIEEDIMEKEIELDATLKELKKSWTTIISTYSITSFIGIILLSLTIEKKLTKSEY